MPSYSQKSICILMALYTWVTLSFGLRRASGLNFGFGNAHPRCRYGEMPGSMVSADYNHQTYKWRTLNPDCPLSEKLEELFSMPPQGMMHFQTLGGVRASPITVLQLGDSVERSMHFALYDYAKGRGYSAREVEIPPDGPPDVIKGRSFYFLLADKMTMLTAFCPGVHPTEPFFHKIPQSMAIFESFRKAMGMLHQATGKPSPDMLILGGQLWDIARWYLTGPHLVNFRVLPLHLLHAWMADLTKALQVIEASVGKDTVLIYHTTVFPKFEDPSTSDLIADANHGRRAHYHQMIAAAREVLRRHPRWNLVDYQQMTAVFHHNEHLHDVIHPAPWFSLEAFNVFLNHL